MPRQERSKVRMHKKTTLFVFVGVFLSAFLGLAGFVPAVFAGMQTFEKDYTYEAGEADSKLSCRTISLEQAKRLLLEELGTYLESRTEVKNFQLTKDQITSLTAGAVKTEIVSEAWDGRIYRLKARITADPDEVAKAVKALRADRDKSAALEKSRAAAAQYLQEIEKLKKELASAQRDAAAAKRLEYSRTVNKLSAVDWYEQGLAHFRKGEMDQAARAFTKAIEVDPELYPAIAYRGHTYSVMHQQDKAIADYNRMLEKNPRHRHFVFGIPKILRRYFLS